MTMRNLARASATGLLAVGALALAATPALAADVDFSVGIKGTTIALGAKEKPATLSITNNGTTKPAEVGLRFDATKLDGYKVALDLGECTFEKGIADCVLKPESIPAPGATGDFDLQIEKIDGAKTGSAGKLTVTVIVEGDTNKANDSKTVDVKLPEKSGADLRVLAEDVSKIDEDTLFPTGKPLQPGEPSIAWGYIANHGDEIANGVKLEVKLPKDVTFVPFESDACTFAESGASVSCVFDGKLIPWDADDQDHGNSAEIFPFAVTVSEDAKGPVTLKGGVWKAAAVDTEAMPRAMSKSAAPAELEKLAGARDLTAAEVAKLDVDATDNTDTFVALVAGPAAGEGGGTGGGDDNDPGLPVTGPVAGSIAGAGVAVLAVGAAFFMMARRRRVVLVTPADGK